jgi:hypothetical protein
MPKGLNIFFCVLFIIFAGLQYNDPDPHIWIPIYLYASILCYLASKKRIIPVAYIFALTVFSIYAIYLFFDKTGVIDWATDHQAENIAQTMKATKPWIEETREFFGLMILIIVLSVNYVSLKKAS